MIKEITGEVVYVRPPYGSWDKYFEKELNMIPALRVVDELQAEGYTFVTVEEILFD